MNPISSLNNNYLGPVYNMDDQEQKMVMEFCGALQDSISKYNDAASAAGIAGSSQ